MPTMLMTVTAQTLSMYAHVIVGENNHNLYCCTVRKLLSIYCRDWSDWKEEADSRNSVVCLFCPSLADTSDDLRRHMKVWFLYKI